MEWNRCIEQALKSPSRLSNRATQGTQIMWLRTISLAVFCCMTTTAVFSPAYALTQEELVAKLKSAGYSQIGEIKSSPEGNIVKAKKNGKAVSVVVDSSGQILERH
jgi:hypothetical protein